MTDHFLWRNVGLTSFLLLLIGSTVVFAGQTQKGSKIQFYGFLRMDMAYDTSRMSDTQIPVFVRSEDPEVPQRCPRKSERIHPLHPYDSLRFELER